MLLTRPFMKTVGRLKLAVLFFLTITVADFFNIQGEDPMRACFDQRCRHYRMAEMHLTAPIVPLQTSGTLDCKWNENSLSHRASAYSNRLGALHLAQ